MNDSLVIGVGKNDFESAMRYVEISKSALTRHSCILGATGSGKSTTACVIALELASIGVPTVILDRTGEYSMLLGDYGKTKVWEPGRNLVMALFGLEAGVPLPVQIEGWVGVVNHFTLVTYGAQVSPLQSRSSGRF
jgi:DNA helicase HerA-like ATPase